jgi:bacterioferritin-associated ferredoxin
MERRRLGASSDFHFRPIGGLRRGPMIVCSCNAFSDRDVQSTIAGVDRRPRMSQVYASLGCSAKCGRCTPAVKRIMDEAWALEPAEERPACGSPMKASPFARADAIHPRRTRFAGCPSPWRQCPPGKSPGSPPVWNSVAANSHRGKPGCPGALAERSPLERQAIGTPLHERGECLGQAA